MVTRFPRPYSVAHCASLSRETGELFASSPLLFWLLVRFSVSRKWEDRKFIRIATKKRTEILTIAAESNCMLDRSAVKFIEKLKFHKIVGGESRRIARSVTTSLYRELRKYRYPSVELINVIEQFPTLMNAPWLRKSDVMSSGPGKASSMVRDILDMAEYLDCEETANKKLFTRTKWQKVVEYHDDLVAEFNAVIETEPLVLFPEPPVAGTESIVPVVNSVVLVQEALTQDNCVYSYLDDILEGRYYIYQVKGPERATLGLSILPGGGIIFDQLLAHGNQQVSAETSLLVNTWLKNYFSQYLNDKRFMADYKERWSEEIMQDYYDVIRGLVKT